MPSTIEQVHQQYGERGLAVLPISIEEGRRKVSAWADRQRLTLPLLLDPGGEVSAAYRITATPSAFLVDRDGRLIARAVGTRSWLSEPGRAVLQRLLRK